MVDYKVLMRKVLFSEKFLKETVTTNFISNICMHYFG